MIITNLQLRNSNSDGTHLEAIISVTFDDLIVIHDIKIISNENRYFLAMPSRKIPNGTFRDIAHPISRDARDALENIAVTAFLTMRRMGLPYVEFRMRNDCYKRSFTEQTFEDFMQSEKAM